MSWSSWGEFVAMGGQGAYVWGAFIVFAIAMALEPWLLALRRRNILDYLRRRGAERE